MKKVVFPNLPSGNCIFCDDIRYEISGKRSFIGVYGSHLFTPEIPFIMPQLSVSVEFRENVDVKEDVEFKLLFEHLPADYKEDENFIPTEFDVGEVIFQSRLGNMAGFFRKRPKGFMMKSGRFDFTLNALRIPSRGRIKARAYRGNTEIRLGTLNVELAEETG